MFAPASRPALYLLVMQQTGDISGRLSHTSFQPRETRFNQVMPWSFNSCGEHPGDRRVSPPRRVRNSRFGHRQELRIDGGQSGGIAESTALLNRGHLQQIIAAEIRPMGIREAGSSTTTGYSHIRCIRMPVCARSRILERLCIHRRFANRDS